MSDYINESLLGTGPMKNQAAESKKLVNKWEKTGLLDGLNQEFQKSGMAVMLENQAKQLISEATFTGGGNRGAAAGANSEEWSGVALPLVRRIFGEIAAQDFVSVQPMNLPSGLVFYLDFKYGKTTGGSEADGFGNSADALVPGDDVNSLQGKSGPNTPSGSSAPYGVGGLYGEGRYDYSINSAIATGADAAADSADDADATAAATATTADTATAPATAAAAAAAAGQGMVCPC